MKKIGFVLISMLIVLSTNFSVNALTYGGCEYSEISRLKSLVSNVNLTFDYYIKNNEVYFNITINNIVPEVYFVDSVTGKTYTYASTNNGEIIIRDYKKTSGSYKFYSALSNCYGIKLSNKYYQLPTYNRYYNDPLCQQNRNYSLCQKWAKVNYSYSDFKNSIEEYNRQKNNKDDELINSIVYEKTVLDKIVDFYTKYYYIILISIIVICVVVMTISRRKNRFDI